MDAVKEMSTRHTEVSRLAVEVCLLATRQLLEDVKDKRALKPHEIARLLDIASKLERLSLGQATERVEEAGPGKPDLKKLSDAELDQFEKLLRKAT